MTNQIPPNSDNLDAETQFFGAPDALRKSEIVQEPLIAETQGVAAKGALGIAELAETQSQETATTDPQHLIDNLEKEGAIPKSPHKPRLVAFLRLLKRIGLDTSSMTTGNFKEFLRWGLELSPMVYILLSTPAEVLARDLQVGDNMKEIAELVGEPQRQYNKQGLAFGVPALILITVLARMGWKMYRRSHPKAPRPATDATATPRRRLRLPFTRRKQEDPQAETVIDEPTIKAFAAEIQDATKEYHHKRIFHWNDTDYKNPAKLERNKPIIIAAINNVFGHLTDDQRHAYDTSDITDITLGIQGRGFDYINGEPYIEIRCTGDITQDSIETTLIQALTDKGIITEDPRPPKAPEAPKAPGKSWRDRLRRDPPEVRAQNQSFKRFLKNIAKEEGPAHYNEEEFGPFTQEKAKRYVDALNQSPEQTGKKEIWINAHNGSPDPAAIAEFANIRIRKFAINIGTQTITLALAEELQRLNAAEVYIRLDTDKIENILRNPELIDKLARINCPLLIHDDTASDDDNQRLADAIARNPNHIPQSPEQLREKYGLKYVACTAAYEWSDRVNRAKAIQVLDRIVQSGLIGKLRIYESVNLHIFGEEDDRAVAAGAGPGGRGSDYSKVFLNLKKSPDEIAAALQRHPTVPPTDQNPLP